MREYFDAEMRQLHEAAQEFAHAYPEQASQLNLDAIKDRDPYVERLLEGVAFLSAQIRQTIDDDIPEVSEGLLSLMWPHLLRPMPSTTIVEFNPRQGQLQQTQILPKHASLLATPVSIKASNGIQESVTCRFRTVYPVELQPIRLKKVTAEEPATGGTLFKYHFKLDPGVKIDALSLTQLKIYLHTDPNIAMLLYKALVGGARMVQVRFPEEPTRQPSRLGGQEMVVASHLDTDESLIPLSGQSFSGFHLLHDYFSFREKYLFLSLKGLDQVSWPERLREFEIEVYCNEILPRDVSVSADMFKLHCCPAINLFKRASEPVRLTQQRYDYPVIADFHSRQGTEVYSIDEVVGIDGKTGDRFKYDPLYSFKHDLTGRYFYASRRVLGSGRPETYITVSDDGSFKEQTLSCEITASNGHIPRANLQIGSVNTPSADFPGFVSFANITRPTRMLLPPDREAFQWALISHMAMNYASLSDTDTFRRLLSLYEWSAETPNQRRIAGLEIISCKPAELIKRGALMRGMELVIRMNDNSFGSTADSYLFGTVLHKFFSSYANVNSFISTRIQTHPSNEEFVWQPTFGDASPI
ncbi:MAG: type VI secretion system baseplate subunit TssF [Acidiferrobacterales bacterium]